MAEINRKLTKLLEISKQGAQFRNRTTPAEVDDLANYLRKTDCGLEKRRSLQARKFNIGLDPKPAQHVQQPVVAYANPVAPSIFSFRESPFVMAPARCDHDAMRDL